MISLEKIKKLPINRSIIFIFVRIRKTMAILMLASKLNQRMESKGIEYMYQKITPRL